MKVHSCVTILGSYFLRHVRPSVRPHVSVRLADNHAVFEIMWKNMVESETTDNNILRRMLFAFWIIKGTNTQILYFSVPPSKCVIVLFHDSSGFVITHCYDIRVLPLILYFYITNIETLHTFEIIQF
jgi:hypothetical protein